MVIFAGVSLGLLADSWRQARDARALERVFLAELSEDLRADSIGLEQLRRRMSAWDRAATWVVTSPVSDLPADSALESIRDLLFTNLYQSVSSAYVGLKESGQLSLLQSPKIRRAVVDYYERSQPYMLQLNGITSSAWNDFRLLFREYVATDPAEGSQSLWPPGPRRLLQPWSAVRRDAPLLRSVENVGIWSGAWATRIGPVLEANGDLQRAIESYLGIP